MEERRREEEGFAERAAAAVAARGAAEQAEWREQLEGKGLLLGDRVALLQRDAAAHAEASTSSAARCWPRPRLRRPADVRSPAGGGHGREARDRGSGAARGRARLGARTGGGAGHGGRSGAHGPAAHARAALAEEAARGACEAALRREGAELGRLQETAARGLPSGADKGGGGGGGGGEMTGTPGSDDGGQDRDSAAAQGSAVRFKLLTVAFQGVPMKCRATYYYGSAIEEDLRRFLESERWQK